MTISGFALPNAPVRSASPRATPSVERHRWRMGIEARVLVMLTAALIAFGLATDALGERIGPYTSLCQL